MIARIHGKCELRKADVLNICRQDDETYNGLVERFGLDGVLTREPAGEVHHDGPRLLESKLRKMNVLAAVKQALRKHGGMSI